MEQRALTILIHGRNDGPDFSLEKIPLAVLKDFSNDVEALLRGDGKEIDTAALEVSVVPGSFALVTEPVYAPTLLHDIAHLVVSERLDSIDPRRRAVVERWQKNARSKHFRFEIRSQGLERPVVISQATDFRADDADQWVRVERYVRGEITDLGGSREPNAHIKLPDGKTITARTDKDFLRADKTNRLYKPALVRVRAEYNVLTKELRDVSLIEFVEYAPRFDPDAFAKMTERGGKAWQDVDSATEWVEELRGGRE